MKRRKINWLKSTGFLVQSLLLYVLLYISFFAVGGLAVWYGCVLLKFKWTHGHLPYDLPTILIIVLVFGGILLICKMCGSLAAIQKTDRPDLKKITESDYPELFRLIGEVATSMRVKPPRQVYLSATATASVFLKTGFWNALFPVDKKLEIGMGLLPFLNQEELRAVLAHEFGHFSQRSMGLKAPVHTIGQSAQYLSRTIRYKKRGAIEDSYYIFTYLFRLLADALFSALTKSYRSFSTELEYEADYLAVKQTGSRALVSALFKASFASHTFRLMLKSIHILAHAQKSIDDMYAAQYRLAERLSEAKGTALTNDFVDMPVTESGLSSLTKKRIAALQSREYEQTSPADLKPALDLLPDHAARCRQFTRDMYRNQFTLDLPALNPCSLSTYNQWIAKYVCYLETMKEPGQEIEVEIVLKNNLHRLPLMDTFFWVYWDNKKIGKGWYKKGFSLKTHTSAGTHHLKIEGQNVKYEPMPVLVENGQKHVVSLDYKCFVLKGEYRFFIKDEK